MGCASPAPKTTPGANSVGTMASANSLKSGSPSGVRRNMRSGMNTGTSFASARRKSVCIVSISGSPRQRGSVDSSSFAPRRSPSTLFISCAAAVTMGSSDLEFLGYTMDSRMTPMRTPLSAPALPPLRTWAA